MPKFEEGKDWSCESYVGPTKDGMVSPVFGADSLQCIECAFVLIKSEMRGILLKYGLPPKIVAVDNIFMGQNPASKKIIAERVIELQKDDKLVRFNISLAQPVKSENDWHCDLRIVGPGKDIFQSVKGSDALQCLGLSLKMYEAEFEKLIDNGYNASYSEKTIVILT